ncbi:MAG TPA: hypothetical protein VEB20_16920 [Azospirillaceae bacterium]|nr:hypothetical protein [Azospirillaceae bacterium]
MPPTDPQNPAPEPPSIEELARRYLDLWQDQWAAVSTDPEMADAMARLLQAMGQGAMMMAPFLPQAPGTPPMGGMSMPGGFGFPFAQGFAQPFANPFAFGFPSPATPGDRHAHSQPSPPPAGAAPAGAAPGGEPERAADLARRLALLEERLAALAPGPGGTGGEPPPRPRRRRP